VLRSLALQGHRNRSHIPDLLAIFPDRAVGREPATPRSVEDRHPCPLLLVLPCRTDLLLTGNIGGIIRQDQKGIRARQIIDQRPEHLGIAMGPLECVGKSGANGRFLPLAS
jgi:hypothetical protein